jgi:hypothetical protein
MAELCSCGSKKSSDPSNHAKHLKSAKHLRGGLVSYACTPCGVTFKQKSEFTDHCGCQMHKAKIWGVLPYDELGDVSGIVSRDQYNATRLKKIRESFLDEYFERNSAFMVGMQSEVVHVFKNTWREMPVHEFIDLLDFLVTDALESSGIRQKDLDELVLKQGHRADGSVTKPHAFWIKQQLVECFKTMSTEEPRGLEEARVALGVGDSAREERDRALLESHEPTSSFDQLPKSVKARAPPKAPPAKHASPKAPKAAKDELSPTHLRILDEIKSEKLDEIAFLCKAAVRKCRVDFFDDAEWVERLEKDDPAELVYETDRIKQKWREYADVVLGDD